MFVWFDGKGNIYEIIILDFNLLFLRFTFILWFVFTFGVLDYVHAINYNNMVCFFGLWTETFNEEILYYYVSCESL